MAKEVFRDSVRILALDPSTEITGAVLVQYFLSPNQPPVLLDRAAFDARDSCKGTDLSARLVRIRWTREQLYDWLGRFDERPDLVAYETDTNRGHSSSEALKMAAGAYLCLPHLALQPLSGVTRQVACIYAGCLKEYRAPRGKTAELQRLKTQALKNAVCVAMDKVFPELDLTGPATWSGTGMLEAEAIADALAIGGAAAIVWREKMRILQLPKQPKIPATRKKEVAA